VVVVVNVLVLLAASSACKLSTQPVSVKGIAGSARQKYRDLSWMVKGKILVCGRPDRVIVTEQLTKKPSHGESK
jgi:hypothetical protein